MTTTKSLLTSYADVKRRLYGDPPKPVNVAEPPKPKLVWSGPKLLHEDGQRWREIANDITMRTGYTFAELKGRSRVEPLASARLELYYRMRMDFRRRELSWPEIGRIVGGRDHSTCLDGARKHAVRNGLKMP